MLMKRVERVYLSDVNLHIVLASISKRIITDILPLGYILSSTYICQIYLSYVCTAVARALIGGLNIHIFVLCQLISFEIMFVIIYCIQLV